MIFDEWTTIHNAGQFFIIKLKIIGQPLLKGEWAIKPEFGVKMGKYKKILNFIFYSGWEDMMNWNERIIFVDFPFP